jgi:hypothetical protein
MKDYKVLPPRLNHWMTKAAVQKLLSLLPAGGVGNAFCQRYVTRTLALDSARFERAVLQCRQHLESYFAIWGRFVGGTTIFELGSGWYPIFPIGMYLCGASRVTTLDIEPLLSAERVWLTLQFYCQYAEDGRLGSLLPWIDRRKVHSLAKVLSDPNLRSVEELLRPMGISAKVGDARDVELGSEPIDFFFSNSVLQHIPAHVLRDMFKRFRRLAAPGAVMSHYIYMGDPFIDFDPATTPYNFLRYSSRAWRLIDNSLKPHNRLRLSDYCRLHREAGWEVLAEDSTLGSAEDLRRVPLAKEFRHYCQRDLLAVRSWLAFRCDQNGAFVEDHPEICRKGVGAA